MHGQQNITFYNMSTCQFVVLERYRDDARFWTLFWSVLLGWRMDSCEFAVQRQWSFRIIDRNPACWKAEKRGLFKDRTCV